MNIEIKKELNHPIEKVWNFFANDFGDIGLWADFLASSSIDRAPCVGALRTCVLEDGSELNEKITGFDKDNYKLDYDVTAGLPAMMKYVNNAWSFKSTDKGTEATSYITIEIAWWAFPMGPIVKMNFKKILINFMENLDNAIK